MFNNYKGFHLVQSYHDLRHMRKYHPTNTFVRFAKIAVVALVTLLLWNMPTNKTTILHSVSNCAQYAPYYKST